MMNDDNKSGKKKIDPLLIVFFCLIGMSIIGWIFSSSKNQPVSSSSGLKLKNIPKSEESTEEEMFSEEESEETESLQDRMIVNYIVNDDENEESVVEENFEEMSEETEYDEDDFDWDNATKEEIREYLDGLAEEAEASAEFSLADCEPVGKEVIMNKVMMQVFSAGVLTEEDYLQKGFGAPEDGYVYFKGGVLSDFDDVYDIDLDMFVDDEEVDSFMRLIDGETGELIAYYCIPVDFKVVELVVGLKDGDFGVAFRGDRSDFEGYPEIVWEEE